MPGVSSALCVGGSEGEGKGKAVEGENVLAEAGRCAAPLGAAASRG